MDDSARVDSTDISGQLWTTLDNSGQLWSVYTYHESTQCDPSDVFTSTTCPGLKIRLNRVLYRMLVCIENYIFNFARVFCQIDGRRTRPMMYCFSAN